MTLAPKSVHCFGEHNVTSSNYDLSAQFFSFFANLKNAKVRHAKRMTDYDINDFKARVPQHTLLCGRF